MQKIANELIKLGALTATGTTKWTVSNVGRVLKNPTYMGYQAYGKSVSNNYLDQKRINNYNEETYLYVKCDFEPIVSEEEWHEVEKIRKRRTHELEAYTRKDPFLGEVLQKQGMKDTHYLWKDITRCKCGSKMRRNRWHKNEFKDWSYGLQCYHQLTYSSKLKRTKLGADGEGYCDMSMMAEWKLDFMAYEIFKMLFADKKIKSMVENAIKIIEKCYSDKPVEHDLKAINREIYKLKQKVNNLIDMRADGDIDKEEYRRRRSFLDAQINELEDKKANVEDEIIPVDTKNAIDEIRNTLKQTFNIEGPILEDDFVRCFVSRVIVLDKNKFRWIINLSGKEYDPEVDDSSEIQLTKVLTFEQARAWRLSNGDYIRNRQWQDLEIDIRII